MKNKCPIRHFRPVAAVPLLLCLFLTATSFGLPCKGQIANIGETMDEVAAKCGEATLKDQRTVTIEEPDEEGTISTTAMTIDEWTYDSGPDELVQSYRFENGRVREIGHAGNGYVRDFSIDTCRNGESLKVGDSTIETYLKCGEPLAKEKRENKVIESNDGVTKRRTHLSVVEWTYRYGRELPGYTVTFENGVAANIRTREFGK